MLLPLLLKNSLGLIDETPTSYGFPDAGTSGEQTFIKTPDNKLYATGLNTSGQLGIGNKTNSPILNLINSIDGNVKSIVSSIDNVSFILTHEGKLYGVGTPNIRTWGNLGTVGGTTFELLMSDVNKIANFKDNTFVLKNDGTLWGSGVDTYYQLTSAVTNKTIFTQIPITDVVDIAVSLYHGLAVKSDGTLWGTGNNGNGALAEIGSVSVFTQMSLPSGKLASRVYGTNYSTIVLMTDGTLWGCGNTSYGELGFGNNIKISTLTQMGSSLGDSIKKFAPGLSHTAILLENGNLYTCGIGNDGRLGNGSIGGSYSYILVATNVKDIGCNAKNTFIVKNDNTLWGCGAKLGLGIGIASGTQATFIQIL